MTGIEVHMKNELRRKRVVRIVWLIIMISILHSLAFSGFLAVILTDEFNPYIWENVYYLRHRMIPDLEERYDLHNMTFEQIIELLGVNRAFIDDYESGREVYYVIGGEYGITYSFFFDTEGNVDYVAYTAHS